MEWNGYLGADARGECCSVAPDIGDKVDGAAPHTDRIMMHGMRGEQSNEPMLHSSSSSRVQ